MRIIILKCLFLFFKIIYKNDDVDSAQIGCYWVSNRSSLKLFEVGLNFAVDCEPSSPSISMFNTIP